MQDCSWGKLGEGYTDLYVLFLIIVNLQLSQNKKNLNILKIITGLNQAWRVATEDPIREFQCGSMWVTTN